METHVILSMPPTDDGVSCRTEARPFVTELNRHLTQGLFFVFCLEKLMEGGEAAGQSLSYTNTCGQMSDHALKLLSAKAEWMPPVLCIMSLWATLPGNMQGGGVWEAQSRRATMTHNKTSHFLRSVPPCRATRVFGRSNRPLPIPFFHSPLPIQFPPAAFQSP